MFCIYSYRRYVVYIANITSIKFEDHVSYIQFGEKIFGYFSSKNQKIRTHELHRFWAVSKSNSILSHNIFSFKARSSFFFVIKEKDPIFILYVPFVLFINTDLCYMNESTLCAVGIYILTLWMDCFFLLSATKIRYNISFEDIVFFVFIVCCASWSSEGTNTHSYNLYIIKYWKSTKLSWLTWIRPHIYFYLSPTR